MIANEHLLSSEEISSLSTGSVGGASVSSESAREGGVSAGGGGEIREQREESPASSRSDQEHYETQMVSCHLQTNSAVLVTSL